MPGRRYHITGSSNKGISNEKIPWYPTINQDLCGACGVCLKFCNNNVFAEGELTTVVANPYNCIFGCTACLNECLSDAISLPGINTLAAILCNLGAKHKITR